jgi:hypothetical protein
MVKVLVAWSLLERKLGNSLAQILNTQPEIGIEVYLSLEHNSAQIKVIRDTASMVMDEADLTLFDALIALVRKGGKNRNRIAHGIWGVCLQIQNGLVLAPTKHLSRVFGAASVLGNIEVDLIPDNPLAGELLQRERELANTTLVYYDFEFEEMRAEISETIKLLSTFWAMRSKSGNEREQLRRQLCETPAIQKLLFHQLKDQTIPP